ncbi:MAG: hypothetical protein AAGD06_14405 [Acidobacteriota bacterium]
MIEHPQRNWTAIAWPKLLAIVAVAGVIGLVAAPSKAGAQGSSSVLYRGNLALDGKPLDTGGQPGGYDFEFSAHNHPEVGQGEQIGVTVQRPGLPISNGAFEAELDFRIPDLTGQRLWIETAVFQGQGAGRQTLARLRQALDTSPRPAGSAPQPTTQPRPVTSDSEILARLPSVRVVISDRQTPGSPHFLIDEDSFRRAYGLGSPVTTLDVASLGVVAASELRREVVRSNRRVQDLQIEVGQLRFRANLTLLLLAVVVIAVFAQRRRGAPPESDSTQRAPEAGPTPAEPNSDRD